MIRIDINLLYKTIEALRDEVVKLKNERDQMLEMYNREHRIFEEEIAATREARNIYFKAIREVRDK